MCHIQGEPTVSYPLPNQHCVYVSAYVLIYSQIQSRVRQQNSVPLLCTHLLRRFRSLLYVRFFVPISLVIYTYHPYMIFTNRLTTRFIMFLVKKPYDTLQNCGAYGSN